MMHRPVVAIAAVVVVAVGVERGCRRITRIVRSFHHGAE